MSSYIVSGMIPVSLAYELASKLAEETKPKSTQSQGSSVTKKKEVSRSSRKKRNDAGKKRGKYKTKGVV